MLSLLTFDRNTSFFTVRPHPNLPSKLTPQVPIAFWLAHAPHTYAALSAGSAFNNSQPRSFKHAVINCQTLSNEVRPPHYSSSPTICPLINHIRAITSPLTAAAKTAHPPRPQRLQKRLRNPRPFRRSHHSGQRRRGAHARPQRAQLGLRRSEGSLQRGVYLPQ